MSNTSEHGTTTRWSGRTTGLLVTALSYAAALLVGLQVFHMPADASFLLRLVLADTVATLLIWFLSLLLSNATLYDPYWSVQPVVILNLVLLSGGAVNTATLLLCGIITLWGVRLTVNWIRTFRGLRQQDWRYDLLRSRSGSWYPLVNLAGIQLLPTFIVLACTWPAVRFIQTGGAFTLLTVTGLLLSASGALLEAAADRQMHAFRRQRTDPAELIDTGLWKYARHPNYLGEILVWWGVYLVFLSATPRTPADWLMGIGAVANTLLFLFISIPMAERRLARRSPDFAQYRLRTRMLLPLPRRTVSSEKENARLRF